MSNILFTWELGGNLGHLWRHLPIARLLKQRGHKVLFAVKLLDESTAMVGEDGFPLVQAPVFSSPEAAARELLNYADILAANGFGDPEKLAGLMDEWHSIFREFRPDVVVAQYAPLSQLAARLARAPLMRIDCGFGCPPDEIPFPCFRPWLNAGRDDLIAREQQVLNNINQVSSDCDGPVFISLQELFKTSADLLLTVPELDHYTGRRNGRYVGPLFNLCDGVEIEWPEGPSTRIFVYLRPFEGLSTILQSLSSSGCNVIAALPGIDEGLRAAFSTRSLLISKVPVRMDRILTKTDIAITHGGHGLVSACLLAGAPMLLVPQMAEQLMTVYNVERLGLGKGVRCDEVLTKFEPALKRMLKDLSCLENARRLSGKYAGYDQAEVVRELCIAIEDKAQAGPIPLHA